MLARLFGAAFAALAFTFLFAVTAFAADAGATTVAIPVGDIVSETVAALLPVVGGIIIWAFRKLPSNVSAVLYTMRADQLLEKAVAYGLNAVAGAEKGKVLNVDVGNKVLAEAASYVVDHGASSVVAWLGGPTAIAEKLVARMTLGSDAQVGTSISTGAGGVAILPAPPAGAVY